MKKISIIAAVLLFAVNAFAASSTVWVVKGGANWIEVHATYTCNAGDGVFTTTVFQDAAGNTLNLAGYYLHHVVHDVGATGVTDNSDLTLPQFTSTGYDVLNGAGTDFLDNADATPLASTKPYVGGAPSAVPIFGPLYLAITQAAAATASATGTLIFKFIK